MSVWELVPISLPRALLVWSRINHLMKGSRNFVITRGDIVWGGCGTSVIRDLGSGLDKHVQEVVWVLWSVLQEGGRAEGWRQMWLQNVSDGYREMCSLTESPPGWPKVRLAAFLPREPRGSHCCAVLRSICLGEVKLKGRYGCDAALVTGNATPILLPWQSFTSRG